LDKSKYKKHLIAYRRNSYILIAVILTVAYIYLRGSDWQGSKNLHTIMESLSTTLAWMVGITSLIRYYSNKQEYLYLFIGAGFIGTGFLDGYHAIVTSSFFDVYFPTSSESLIPWSWVASRLYLSILFFLGWYYGFRYASNTKKITVDEKVIYKIMTVTTFLTFIFFAFVPLPRAYYDEFIFHRPEEFIPALFFAVALVGFYKKGNWKSDFFEHWLVISLVVNLVSQVVFMSFSGHLFDLEFDAAHLLKKISYICVLVGLFYSTFTLFQKADNQNKALDDAVAKERLHSEEISLELESFSKKLESEILEKSDDLVKSNSQISVLLDRFNRSVIASSTNEKGIITYVTDAFCNISGYTKEELIGNTHRVVRHPDMPNVLFEELWNTITAGKEFNAEIKNQKKDGSFYWVSVLIVPEFDSNNNILGYFAIRVDITAKKEIEEFNKTLKEKVNKEVSENRKKDELLTQQAKLAAMGEMVGSIAHQWRQPLNSLSLRIQFLDDDLEDDLINKEYVDEYITESMKLINFMSKTIDDFRNFYRVDKIKSEFCVVSVINSVVNLVSAQLEEHNIKLSIEGDESQTITGLESELQQVILNIINNAKDVFIEKEQKNATINIYVCKENKDVIVTILDNAGGIPSNVIDRVFEPYFTTKEQGKGTGLGLYMSKMIIEDNMNGSINVKNDKDGALFTIKLL